jgi:hypothetical protein
MKKNGMLGDIDITSKEMQAALKANADGGASYIGLNDEMLNIGDAESFIDEADAGKEFTLRLVNGTAATQKIQFNPVLGQTLTGHTLLAEGDVVTVDSSHKLTAAGDPRSYDLLLALIKESPIRVRSIKFNVSDASQLDEPIKYLVDTPFKTGVTEQKIPSTFQDQNTNNTKTVEVAFKNWILGFDSTIQYSIRAGVSVSMTLCLGASVDLANALREKHAAAVKTAATYYARQNG